VKTRHPAERRTVAQSVEITGVGLHTGEPCRIRLHPFEGGLIARHGAAQCPIHWDYVRSTHRAVVVGDGDLVLGTVEHLLAAFWAMGITDCLVEVLEGTEVPTLDGSALPFIELIEAAGGTCALTTPQGSLSSWGVLPVMEPVWVQAEDRAVGVLPGAPFAFGYIQFPSPLGVQVGCFDLRQFREQIAPARTFGFLSEVEALRQQGLARGGSLENVLLIASDGYYNSARFEDEPLRHKVLDVMGDLMLCGALLRDFTLVAIKSGHTLDVQLAQAIAQRLPRWQARMEAQHG
jgi:UDP-3-O-[3-hydroxymyristoyl] N-acetylglucosamine deacetylase